MIKKQIKVLYLISNADSYGSNIALLNLLDQLYQKGVIPVVVMWKYGKICEILEKKEIKFYQVKYRYSVYPKYKTFTDIILFLPLLFRTLWLNLIALPKLKKIAIDNEIDIIHTNISPLHIGYALSKLLHIPHVWHIREYQDIYLGYRPLFTWRRYFRKLNDTNTYPIAITKGLLEHYDLKANAQVIYDGVMKLSQVRFVNEKDKYFLFVGRLEEGKGVMNLVHAFMKFSSTNKEYSLYLAGTGEERYTMNLKQEVIKVGLEKRIKFLGFRSDVYDLMAHATALIVSSSYEGFGFTTVEAMFNGCLVIGKNSGGTKEILDSDSLGILYSTDKDLVDKLKKVTGDRIDSYFSLINNAMETAVKKYSCEKNGEKVLKLYYKILSNQS